MNLSIHCIKPSLLLSADISGAGGEATEDKAVLCNLLLKMDSNIGLKNCRDPLIQAVP